MWQCVYGSIKIWLAYCGDEVMEMSLFIYSNGWYYSEGKRVIIVSGAENYETVITKKGPEGYCCENSNSDWESCKRWRASPLPAPASALRKRLLQCTRLLAASEFTVCHGTISKSGAGKWNMQVWMSYHNFMWWGYSENRFHCVCCISCCLEVV